MKVKLKELGTIITGNTPSKKVSEFYNSNDIGFVKPDIISDSQIDYIGDTQEYLSNLARDKARIVKKDAIFVTCIGIIGKVGIVQDNELAFNQQINAIIPNGKIVPKYLAYCIFANKKRLQTIANAPVVPIINKSQFSDFEIDINLDVIQQKKITEILDKLNEVIVCRKQQLQQLDELVKARFVELFYGSEEVVRLDSLIKPYRAEKCGQNTYPVLSITMHNGLVLQTERFKKEIASGDKSQYKVVPRNKLVVAFPIDEGLLSAQTIVDVGIVSPAYSLYEIDENKIYPEVLEYILRSDLSIQYYKSKLRGTTLRRRMIPKSDFDSMPINLPIIERQKQFLNEIKEIDKSKVVVQKALDEAQTLFDSLMQEYFG